MNTGEFYGYALTISKYALILLSLLILLRCLRSMLSEKYEPEIWGYIKAGKISLPVCNWENTIGRSRGADVRLMGKGIGRIHAVLRRSDKGEWSIHDIFSKGGVWVNGEWAGESGHPVADGDVINLGGSCVRFKSITPKQTEKLEAGRTTAGKRVSPSFTLLELTTFQIVLLMQHCITTRAEYRLSILAAFASLIITEWICYNAMRIMNRSGFEIDTLAFYLSTLGLSVSASSVPADLYKQVILLLVSIGLFLVLGWWLRSLKRTYVLRKAVAVFALILLGVNAAFSEAMFGARNWLEIGGFSFQPSEFVKVGYIYVGAAGLDTLYKKKNLFAYIGFSAACVIALALIGDFGTALIFFITFLVISFMRSGSIATVLLAVSGAGMAGTLAISVKPYIARRFATWGHVWEDVYNTGYQQTRAMSAAASGGLIGKGAGNGWLHGIVAANTDMVFAMISEELGLIVAVCMVLAVVILALFAMRSAIKSRSGFYAIAACAASAMLLTQLALNVFGSVDILPFTGVTFPFVSRGGSSLISCWMLMAFLKGADSRRGASFAVKPFKPAPEDSDEWDEPGYEEE